MIVILKRSDLKVEGLEVSKIRLHHTTLDEECIRRSELIVYTEDGKVTILLGTKWPYGKPMSAAELLRYLAEHAVA